MSDVLISMPSYNLAESLLCKIGLHLASRKVVVQGWVGGGDLVKRAYCACGSRIWVWYAGGWVPGRTVVPAGSHRAWVRGHEEAMEHISQVQERRGYRP
jgi:hypothetical protein